MTQADDSLVAIVVAAGSARRFGGDKLFVRLAGQPVLSWCLRAFEESSVVSSIVVVLSEDRVEAGRQLIAGAGISKVCSLCSGGERRQDSVWQGLQAASGASWVAVHDGARPFVTPALVECGWRVAREVGAAIAAVPVKDTIKVVDKSNLIARTPDRARLWAAQTPQIFRYEQLRAAHAANGGADVTDDAELLERSGLPVAIFPGSYENIKITTPEDLAIAHGIARRRRPTRSRNG